ncbi:hypothetical protein SNEBB_006682 [Seison nebaliae]|nr:hypothetical protein SNEBB_006682 [Seison nebaliae]
MNIFKLTLFFVYLRLTHATTTIDFSIFCSSYRLIVGILLLLVFVCLIVLCLIESYNHKYGGRFLRSTRAYRPAYNTSKLTTEQTANSTNQSLGKYYGKDTSEKDYYEKDNYEDTYAQENFEGKNYGRNFHNNIKQIESLLSEQKEEINFWKNNSEIWKTRYAELNCEMENKIIPNLLAKYDNKNDENHQNNNNESLILTFPYNNDSEGTNRMKLNDSMNESHRGISKEKARPIKKFRKFRTTKKKKTMKTNNKSDILSSLTEEILPRSQIKPNEQQLPKILETSRKKDIRSSRRTISSKSARKNFYRSNTHKRRINKSRTTIEYRKEDLDKVSNGNNRRTGDELSTLELSNMVSSELGVDSKMSTNLSMFNELPNNSIIVPIKTSPQIQAVRCNNLITDDQHDGTINKYRLERDIEYTTDVSNERDIKGLNNILNNITKRMDESPNRENSTKDNKNNIIFYDMDHDKTDVDTRKFQTIPTDSLQVNKCQ